MQPLLNVTPTEWWVCKTHFIYFILFFKMSVRNILDGTIKISSGGMVVEPGCDGDCCDCTTGGSSSGSADIPANLNGLSCLRGLKLKVKS